MILDIITPGRVSTAVTAPAGMSMLRNDRHGSHTLAPNTIQFMIIVLLLSVAAMVMLVLIPEQSVQASSASRRKVPQKPATETRINGPAVPEGAQYYAAPSGSPTGDGSWNNPWDLQTALNQPASVHPGDTIWLRGGTYTGNFQSYLTGTSTAPIIVRQYPGERAVLDRHSVALDGVRATLVLYGGYAWFWGFEITNSDPTRLDPNDNALNRAEGVYPNNSHYKLINLIIHDQANGIVSDWANSDTEIYGCIIYNNGTQGTDRGHGHGLYVQNQTDTKQVRDNILFNGFGYNIHAYADNAPLSGLDFEGNTSFNAAALATTGGGSNILIGGYTIPAERITLNDNYTYFPPGNNNLNVRVGYTYGPTNQDVTFTNNYLAGGYEVAATQEWVTMTVTGNLQYGDHGYVQDLILRPVLTNTYQWDSNAYYYSGGSSTPFLYADSAAQNFQTWKNTTNFDLHSSYTNGRPPNAVFVRPDEYEPGRANITVYNWSLANSVNVDVSGVLTPGAQYEVRNAEDYFAGPILTGTYNGSPLQLPMSGLSVATPFGWTAPPPTGPEFNVFVLSTVSVPPPTPSPTVAIPPTQTATQSPSTATQMPTGQPSSTATTTSTSLPQPTSTPTNTQTSTGTNTPQPPTVQPSATRTPTASPTACRPHFIDVPDGSTFAPYIACLSCKRVLAGYSDNTFRPNNPVTRSQLAKIVANAANFNDAPGPQLFEDVRPNSPFYDYVQRLARRGYIGGYECGGPGEPCAPPANLPYFRPSDTATRGQISKIIANAAGFNDDPGPQLYQDVLPGSPFYVYIQRLSIHNVIGGYPCGGPNEPCGPGNRLYNRPSAIASRGQISKIVSRTFFPSCVLGVQP